MTTEPLKTAAIGTARDYQNLPAWQNSIALAESIYQASEKFPEREHQGLAATMRSTVTMVAGAIAAASGADAAEISDFYRESQTLLAELSTQAELATRLGYIKDASEINEAIDTITRLLIGMQHGLRVAARDAERAARDAERAERNAAREERGGDRGGDRPYKKPFKKFEDGDRPRRDFKDRGERGGREDRPRREFKPRDGEERPRREFKPRDGEERPRREYKPRDDRGGDRPFKKREDRDGGDRPRRDFKKRDDRDGDRPYKKREDSRGDRRGFGGGKKDYSKRDFKPKRRD